MYNDNLCGCSRGYLEGHSNLIQNFEFQNVTSISRLLMYLVNQVVIQISNRKVIAWGLEKQIGMLIFPIEE